MSSYRLQVLHAPHRLSDHGTITVSEHRTKAEAQKAARAYASLWRSGYTPQQKAERLSLRFSAPFRDPKGTVGSARRWSLNYGSSKWTFGTLVITAIEEV